MKSGYIIVFALLALLLPSAPRAADSSGIAGPYAWSDAVLRLTPSHMGAAYLNLKNPTAQADQLISARAPWADHIELHEIKSDAAGVMTMRKIESMALPGKGALVLEQGGYHLMIFGVDETLDTAKPQEITLEFEQAGDLVVPFAIVPLGKADAGHKPAPMHDMDHGATPMRM